MGHQQRVYWRTKTHKMNKRIYLTLGLFAIMVMMFAGCGKSNFAVAINEDLNAQITAENASADSTGTAGTLTVKEGDMVIIEQELEEGTINVQFFSFEGADDIDADADDLMAQGEPAFETDVAEGESLEVEVPAGDYMITATVKEKATGTVIIRSEPAADSGSDESNVSLRINTEGMGQIAYAEEGGSLEFDNEFPKQSAEISPQETSVYVLGAKADEGWQFVKWTKDGEDFSTDEQITVDVEKTTEYIAVFEANE